jgi:hypothetical protein
MPHGRTRDLDGEATFDHWRSQAPASLEGAHEGQARAERLSLVSKSGQALQLSRPVRLCIPRLQN